MGFFNRLSDVVTANFNDLLDRMEDPEKMMKQLVREMERAVDRAKGELVKALAHEKRIEKEIAGRKKKIDEWLARAAEALRKEREDLARKALELKIESQDVLAALEPELAAAKEAAAAMRTQFRALQAKTQEARRKQAALGARSKSAAMRKTAATGGGNVDSAAFAEFERMEEKVDQAESQAAAAVEVASDEKAVEDDFARWEAGREVDAELAALKAKVKKSAK